MRGMARVARWACAAVALTSACSSSKDDNGNKVIPGGGPFGNIAQGGKATSGSGGKGSSSSGSSGKGGASMPDGQCASGLAHTTRLTPRVMMVLDGSCSMTTDYPANGARSETQCRENPNGRWAALRNALIDPQRGVVTRLASAVEFGVGVFGNAPRCPFPTDPIAPTIDNLQAIQGALPMVQPGMYTPAGLALDMIYDMINPDPLDSEAGPNIVIFATDGEPNSCDNADPNYQPSIDAVTKGHNKGILTYVISLADATGMFHDHLQQLADIGAGVTGAQLYEPNNPDELEANLQVLVGGAVGCDIALNGNVSMERACEGRVTLNGDNLKCNGDDGWILTDSRHIRLQGKACDSLKASSSAMLDASFPCGVFMVD
jgi:hypothetical protein